MGRSLQVFVASGILGRLSVPGVLARLSAHPLKNQVALDRELKPRVDRRAKPQAACHSEPASGGEVEPQCGRLSPQAKSRAARGNPKNSRARLFRVSSLGSVFRRQALASLTPAKRLNFALRAQNDNRAFVSSCVQIQPAPNCTTTFYCEHVPKRKAGPRQPGLSDWFYHSEDQPHRQLAGTGGSGGGNLAEGASSGIDVCARIRKLHVVENVKELSSKGKLKTLAFERSCFG